MNRGFPAVLAAVCAGLAAAGDAQAQTFNYCAFGDSNTCGKYDGNTTECDSTNPDNIDPLHPDGYPGRLRKLAWLDCATNNCQVYNYGLPGEKTVDGVTRLPGVLNEQDFDVLLLMHGTNDVFKGGISNNTIEFNLGEMDDLASARGVDTLHGSIIRFHPDGEKGTSKDSQIASLRNRVSDLAAARNRYFADPWAVLCPTESCFENHYAYPKDIGLHPDASGYNLMATAFSSVIRAHDPPAAPTAISPTGGDGTASTTVTWSETDHSTWYQVQWDTGVGEWVDSQDVCSAGSCSWPIPSLPPGDRSWQVRGRNPRGWGALSAPANFHFYSSPPNVPDAFDPEGAFFHPTPPEEFTWSDEATATNGATGYQLKVDFEGTTIFNQDVIPTCSGGECSIADPGISWDAGNYSWQVRSENPAGASAFSTKLEFFFADSAPATPEPIHPTDDTFDTTPLFQWTHEFGAEEYRIQVDGGAAVDETVLAANVCGNTTCSWESNASLSIGNHNWRVQAKNQIGDSSFSSNQGFEVLACSPENENLTLSNHTVNSSEEEAACNKITAGNNYVVAGPDGDLELHAGQKIGLEDGFVVESGGELRCRVDP